MWKRSLLAVVALLAGAALVVRLLLGTSGGDEVTAGGDEHLDPAVQVLLRERAQDDPGRSSPFFTTLASLAHKHGDNYAPETWVDEGYAVRLRSGRQTRVVVILRGPVRDIQYFILLAEDGRRL